MGARDILKAGTSLSKRGKWGAVITFIAFQVWNVLIGIYYVMLGVYVLSVSLGFVVMGFMVAYAVGLLLTPLEYQGEEDA